VNATKQRAGRLGGLATVARHGQAHMARIGRIGALEQQRRYKLVPAGLAGWALICRRTGRVVSIWS
jgi:hypothetical protein